MKPVSPHDPLDDLIAAALHGELTPEERAQFESRLQTDPAAQAAYQEAQAMHDLLTKNYVNAQPDPAFEQRMVSGVRRKLQHEQQRETAWESLVALWAGVKGVFRRKRTPIPFLGSTIALLVIIMCLAGVALGPITNGIKQAQHNPAMQLARQRAEEDYQAQIDAGNPNPVMKDPRQFIVDGNRSGYGAGSGGAGTEGSISGKMEIEHRIAMAQRSIAVDQNGAASNLGPVTATRSTGDYLEPNAIDTPQGGAIRGAGFGAPASAPPDLPTHAAEEKLKNLDSVQNQQLAVTAMPAPAPPPPAAAMPAPADRSAASTYFKNEPTTNSPPGAESEVAAESRGAPNATPAPAPTTAPAIDTRKLIRNAQLDLEVKSYQTAMDEITALTKAAGGYVDTSNSEKGGNGKLQGTVVVKVLPQNLDDFLLKLRDLGQVQNQSVSTEDVTKDYYDTQARLDNSRRMEEQLQDLLKHANSKVSDLLQVERELGRVRGDIEQMQGQLKLYDFQVEYATVTMNLREKDMNQAAAYLLKEQDDFSLFATDVEATFQKARQAADEFKAQILVANLIHNSGSDVAAELTVKVAPDQIEPFLAEIRGLGRVANFTRQTQRVAKDGGDSDQPADETKTEKDKVQVHLSIRSDDETRKQVALTVVAKAVDDALDQAKTAALSNAGVEILSSSLNKTSQGQSTAQLSVRVPGKNYSAVIAAFKALGRAASLSIQRNDNSGPGSNGDDAPVIISLALTDDDTPLQATEMSVIASDVDQEAQQIKKDAAAAGVEVKASSFERQPNGTELAQMTFRLPMAKYPSFLDRLKALGKVESLSVSRDDRPDQTVTDDTAPVEVALQMHNQAEIVPDNSGLWATLRQTFADGVSALFGSVRVIGVAIAFLVPWAVTLVIVAWIGRRIYVSRKK